MPESDPVPAPPDANDSLNFEQSLAELQRIVRDLEDGRLGLEESMRRFEQGIGLLRRCYQVLERAEQKIEILTGFDAAGQPMTQPFDATATASQSEQTAGRRRPRREDRRVAPEPAEPAEPIPDEDTQAGRLF